MSDAKTSQTQSAKQDMDSERVSRAAAELGMEVPVGFRLVGVGEDGQLLSRCAGNAADFRAAVAICRRLDGVPVADCWADPDRSEDEKPVWAPPDDWSDTKAVLAYLAEQNLHPEWPRFSNSWGDVAVNILLNVVGSLTWEGLKRLALQARAAASSELSREDAILIGAHAVVNEFVRLDRDVPNLEALICCADQLRDGNWRLLFHDQQHIAVRVDLSFAAAGDIRSDVTILTLGARKKTLT